MMLVAIIISSAVSESIYGAKGTVEVVADHFDDLTVIETVDKPRNIKPVREARYTNVVIEDGEYPWPGHSIDLSLSQKVSNATLIQEGIKISQAFAGNTNVAQAELYRHPAGPQQHWGTQEAIDKADRVKAKYMLDPAFGYWHFTGIYMPPGELITVEIPEGSFGKMWFAVNIHSTQYGSTGFTQRLPRISWEDKAHRINQKVSTIGWPYGGSLYIGCPPDAFPEPIELTITGGILTPWFRYGVDTDEDWDVKKKYAGLVAVLETGNIQMSMPAHFIRSSTRMNDACRFFRSCAEVMESTVMKTLNLGHHQRPNGREKMPNYWWFDQYVPAGAAVAFVGADFSCYPVGWAGNAVNIESAMKGCWGLLHEMGHHHQGGWGIGSTGEVTNNVLITICYAYFSVISSYRVEQANGGGWSSGSEWQFVTHPYFAYSSNSDLGQYVSLIHAFGTMKMREFINADNKNLYYDRNVYGRVEAYLLRAAKVFGYDFRPHLQFYGYNLNNATQYNQTSIRLLDSMKLKKWYPIASLYATGYEVDGEVFETARPFRIASGETHIFNFTKYALSRPGYGNFVLEGVSGRAGAWKDLGQGVYEYTPMDSVRDIDDFRVTYRETTTDQVTVCYGKLEQSVNGNSFARYNNIRSPQGKTLPVLEAYNKTRGLAANRTGRGNGMVIPTENSNTDAKLGAFVSECKGKFVAPSTGTYTFFAAPDDAALFYLSENPLTGDVDQDAQYLILTDDRGYHGYNLNYPSLPVNLTAGKVYYFCFVIYNHGGSGGGKMGYRIGTGNIGDALASQVIIDSASAEDLESSIFRPNWEEIRGLDDLTIRSSLVPVDRSKWNFTRIPGPEENNRPARNLIDGKRDNVYITKWSPKNSVPFPHVFEVDFGTKSEFDNIELSSITTGGFKGYLMNSYIEVSCGTASGTNETVYAGMWDNRNQSKIDLGRKISCESLTLQVFNNSFMWSEYRGLIGGSQFSEISAGTVFNVSKVYPASNPTIAFEGRKWTNETYGAHFNGLGKRGTSGATMRAKFTETTEVVVLGDKWQTGAVAKLLGSKNRASVYVDDVKHGEFTNEPTYDDLQTNKASDRLYKQVLYIVKGLNPKRIHEVKVIVESGEVVIAGFLTQNGVRSSVATLYEGGGSAGVIAGGVIGGLIVVAAVIAAVVVVMKNRLVRRKKSASPPPTTTEA